MSRYVWYGADDIRPRDGDTPPESARPRDGRVLGGHRLFTSPEVVEQLGISMHSARRLWRALGFPAVDPTVAAFTERDVEAGRRLVELVRTGVVTNYAGLELVRAAGRAMDLLSTWQVEVLAEQVRRHRAAEVSDQGLAPDLALAEESGEVAELVSTLVEELEWLVRYVWRRHLSAALTTHLRDMEAPDDPGWHSRCVGFVDLVGFTETIRPMTQQDLVDLVARFEGIAADIVAGRGGRLVKTLGDEVMFLTRSPEAAIDISLDLVTEARGGQLPELRVGVAVGEVVSRMGDVYGNTVNLAARLTDVGPAYSVLIDQQTAQRLCEIPGCAGLQLHELPVTPLKGFGPVRAYEVTRP